MDLSQAFVERSREFGRLFVGQLFGGLFGIVPFDEREVVLAAAAVDMRLQLVGQYFEIADPSPGVVMVVAAGKAEGKGPIDIAERFAVCFGGCDVIVLQSVHAFGIGD